MTAPASPRHPVDRILGAVRRTGAPVCVGLDPHLDLLPPSVRSAGSELEQCRRFLFAVLEAVADVVPAVKPQVAFFEQLGPDGVALYFDTIREAHRLGLQVIGDVKRADIGSTATAYARAHLAADDGSAADLVTLNPYLGLDAIRPFLEVGRERGRGVVALVRTSNPSASDFQDLVVAGEPLYVHVGRAVEQWGEGCRGEAGFGDVAAVVGATSPAEGTRLREILPATWFLIPGYGAQGGTARDVAAMLGPAGEAGLVSASRSVLFAWRKQPEKERDFAGLAREAARAMVLEIRLALQQVARASDGR